jgi:hypothetical protein
MDGVDHHRLTLSFNQLLMTKTNKMRFLELWPPQQNLIKSETITIIESTPSDIIQASSVIIEYIII